MGVQLGVNRGKARYRPLSEINVTPLVDVMLVLLVIFMITAPLMTSSVNVDLPKANATALAPEKDPITVSVAPDGKVYLANDGMDLTDLVARLQAQSQSDPDRRIYVRGDKTVPYGRMIEVMGTIKQGGFNKVALLVEQTEGAPGSAITGTAAPTVRPTPPPFTPPPRKR
jgi:biopolymer transport protein TolR